VSGFRHGDPFTPDAAEDQAPTKDQATAEAIRERHAELMKQYGDDRPDPEAGRTRTIEIVSRPAPEAERTRTIHSRSPATRRPSGPGRSGSSPGPSPEAARARERRRGPASRPGTLT
jgi:hypothetical protein